MIITDSNIIYLHLSFKSSLKAKMIMNIDSNSSKPLTRILSMQRWRWWQRPFAPSYSLSNMNRDVTVEVK